MNKFDLLEIIGDIDEKLFNGVKNEEKKPEKKSDKKNLREKLIRLAPAAVACLALFCVIMPLAMNKARNRNTQLPGTDGGNTTLPPECLTEKSDKTPAVTSAVETTVGDKRQPEKTEIITEIITEISSDTTVAVETISDPKTRDPAADGPNWYPGKINGTGTPWYVISDYVDREQEAFSVYECIVSHINNADYLFYQSGYVIPEDMVGEKLDDAKVGNGWYRSTSGKIEDVEYLRAEIFRIKGVDPKFAVCVKYLDQGDGLTRDHYYSFVNGDMNFGTLSEFLSAGGAGDNLKVVSYRGEAGLHDVKYFEYDMDTAELLAELLASADGEAVTVTLDSSSVPGVKHSEKRAVLRISLFSKDQIEVIVLDTGYIIFRMPGAYMKNSMIGYVFSVGDGAGKIVRTLFDVGTLYVPGDGIVEGTTVGYVPVPPDIPADTTPGAETVEE